MLFVSGGAAKLSHVGRQSACVYVRSFWPTHTENECVSAIYAPFPSCVQVLEGMTRESAASSTSLEAAASERLARALALQVGWTV